MMELPEKIVVIGAGLAGAKTVEQLRKRGFKGSLTLIGNETDPPYDRPPLSKEYLAGNAKFEEALIHPLEWYDEKEIDLRLDATAVKIDPGERTVSLADGSTVEYDALVLATGSSSRRATIPGADADGVLYLRNRGDSDAIRQVAKKGEKFTMIGGGWIGLEVAAVVRSAGADVTVLEIDHLPLARIIGEQAAEVFAKMHREHGVELRTDVEAAEILVENGDASGVVLKDGTVVPADSVLVGIGAIPNVGLAEEAGLTIEAGGVAVDSFLRSSDPAIYAVGDIAAHDHPILKSRIRVEHWATALNQPKAVARTLVGEETEYTELPYFYTDQYDLGMEYIGFVPRRTKPEVVIRGDLDKREFIVFYLDETGTVLAVMTVNIWDVIDVLKPLILEKRKVDKTRLADTTIPLEDL